MRSLSFDSMVKLYDETRVFDRSCFDSALDFLTNRFSPQLFNNVFEPGIGTGRIAIPLAERGYSVTGIDISEEMLAILQKRLARSGEALKISFQKTDMTELPFADAAFDMVIVVHLFYFIREWRKAVDEILRVVKGGGPVVLMHTGMGAEIPFLNNRYKELCAEQGCPIESVGVKSTSEVIAYLTELGYSVEQIRDRWRWISRIRLDKALSYIGSRAYSFSTFAPDNVHFAAVKNLKSELSARFGSLSTAVEVLNQIYLVFIRK
ncbi:class I SAM-dependent methyltransferase [Candidatus Poribacteria bacterium]